MTRPEDKTVLIVDDEPDVRAYFAGILERAGFKVMTAADGEEALELVRGTKPDFISLDLVMPRKSGIKFLYELRRNREWARIPTMIVTAHARDELGKSDFDEVFSDLTMTGPTTYLEKPVRPDRFLASVKRAVGLESPEDSSSEAGAVDLRSEIASRLQDVEPETLQRILRALDER